MGKPLLDVSRVAVLLDEHLKSLRRKITRHKTYDEMTFAIVEAILGGLSRDQVEHELEAVHNSEIVSMLMRRATRRIARQ